MAGQIEADLENALLRPFEPLALDENQRVWLTIRDVPAAESCRNRREEMEWLRLHEEEFKGQWAALYDDALISHGGDARTVRDEARAKRCYRP